MSSEWETGTLGQFIELKRGYDLPQAKRVSGIYPLVSSSGVTDTHHEPMVKGPGVVTGRYGTIGKVFFVSEDFWPLNTTLYVRDFKGNDPKFISYFLQTIDFLAYSDKAAVPGVNRNHLHEAMVSMPNLVIQKQIASVLSALDDRIALLRETNATLEAIAQALFKSWFVDFDPVHAKVRGESPQGMDDATAALFPASFEESELGMVPKGWRVGSIYDIASVIYGAPFASKKFNTENLGIPLIRIRDLKSENPGVYTEEIHPKGYLVQPGDLVVGMDGEFRAYIWGGTPAWLNQRVCVFMPKGDYSSAYVNYTIKPQLASVEATETATTVIHLGKNDIDHFKSIIPDTTILKLFSEITSPIYSKIVEGKLKAQTLAQLRDTLLPKLISGQLRLPEAEELP